MSFDILIVAIFVRLIINWQLTRHLYIGKLIYGNHK